MRWKGVPDKRCAKYICICPYHVSVGGFSVADVGLERDDVDDEAEDEGQHQVFVDGDAGAL